jgi:hypothetical protein
MLLVMTDRASRRSDELEQLRLLLFPHLTADEGWQRIDAAFAAAGESDRLDRIETLAGSGRLDDELLRTLGRFGGNGH